MTTIPKCSYKVDYNSKNQNCQNLYGNHKDCFNCFIWIKVVTKGEVEFLKNF